ncbi:MAG TPA: ankyrin repeat domain-containing protein [Terriglobales bacterium]|jgi:ankyrin repeat protein
MLDRIAEGRTDLVFDYIAQGNPISSKTADGTSLIQWCAYYGDVSAIRFLLGKGESVHSLGDDLGLNAAAFHGHWRLCEFLIENGADTNSRLPSTGETPLHAALSSSRPAQHNVVKVLLNGGADPNFRTNPSSETGAFMRDSRTKGETPLHRAAAFAGEETIQLLVDAGATVDAKDSNGDTPLSWASWRGRPDAILRKLCYGPHSIRPDRRTMDSYLLGTPMYRR